jgi:probable phosphomutase (TIGR03848 family)
VKTGKLAGWTPGVHLNEDGRAQAAALGIRLAKVRIDALYSSPLERTVETAQAVLEHHPGLTLQLLDALGEVHYGTWQGEELSKLSRRKLWQMVQFAPSQARFPGGEAMRETQLRAVNALEDLTIQHPHQTVAVVSHCDVIKMVVAHYLGLHLDRFQRIEISPASLTIIAVAHGYSAVIQVNETSYLPAPQKPPQKKEGGEKA